MKARFAGAGLVGLALLAASSMATAQDAPKKELKIVTEGGFIPWNRTNPDGTVGGFEIELMAELCKRMNVTCTFSAQSFDTMIPALNAGKYDAIVDALGITPARQEVIAFSTPYAELCYSFGGMKASGVATTLPPDDKTVQMSEGDKSPVLTQLRDGLKGRTIGTLAAGTSTRFINAHMKDHVEIKSYKTPDARNLDLQAGRVDVIFASKDGLLALAKKPGFEGFTLAGPCLQGDILGTGDVGVGLRKADTELKAMFDKAITGALGDGTIKRLSEATFGMDMSPK